MGLLETIKSTIQRSVDQTKNSEFYELEEKIGYHFKNNSLLKESLTHPSLDTRKTGLRNNQRLEFLGDSVVGCVLAKWLFQKFPDLSEGELSRKKSLLARGKTLAQIARTLNLQNHLIVGKSESKSSGYLRQAVLEDALEALIGAIYLDSNYSTTERIILKWEEDFQSTLKEEANNFNPKGKLQEFLQSQPDTPIVAYQVIKQSGPDHNKQFKVEVTINGNPVSTGSGKSKKMAEEQAALSAMKKLLPSASEEN